MMTKLLDSRFLKHGTTSLALLSLAQVATGQDAPRLAQGLGAQATAVRTTERYEPNPVEDLHTLSSTKPDVHGTYSVENFAGTQNNLHYTHDSADGFRNYLAQWYSPNYIYRDSGVGVWSFHDITNGDNYDKWTSGTVDYGIDAVLTSFQSSHGGMNTTTKVYLTCMGSNWAGRGWNAYSNKMALGGNASSFGDERLRYMFWDTCQSVMWKTINPMQTWGARAKGIRMIFGYDTDSIDSPNYGKYFWEEWNKGKTFKKAFLDASWRIYHGQSPCMVAFGSTQSDAISRRDNEKTMYWGSVSSSWGAWSWYAAGNGPDGSGSGGNLDRIPRFVRPTALVRRGNSDREVIDIARSLGIEVADASLIEDRQLGLRAVHTGDLKLIVEEDGDFELEFTGVQPGTGTDAPLVDDEVLLARACELADGFELTGGRPYRNAEIRTLGANETFEGLEPAANRVVEKTVVLDQVVADLPFIDADAGHLEISFDAVTLEVTRIRGSIKAIDEDALQSQAPQATRGLAELRQLALELTSEPPTPGVAGRRSSLDILPGSEAVGYVLRNGQPVAAYRAHLADPQQSGNKLIEVIVPLAAGM